MTISVFLKGETSFQSFINLLEHSVHQSPCACHKCLTEDDPWFMERFNKSVNPFLTRKNNLSEDAYSWWKVKAIFSQIIPYKWYISDSIQRVHLEIILESMKK